LFFYYQLAEQLGYASINRMLNEMSSKEVTEWKTYFNYKAKLQEEEMKKSKNNNGNNKGNNTF